MAGTVSDDVLISKLDFGDPLYLHPSDISSTPIITLKLTGTENYRVWSCALTLALQTKNKMGFVNGKVKKDKTNAILGNQWDRCNSVVLSWILGTISEELYLGQVYSTISSEVWTELKETYDKVDGSVVFNLHKKINSLTQNGSSLSGYYHTLNSLWKQFDAMVHIHDNTTEFKEHMEMIKLIEESHKNASSNTIKRNQASAFVTKTLSNQTYNPSNNTRFTRGPNPNLKCTKCNKIGHTIDRCYEVVGYPPSFRGKMANNKSNNNPTSSSWTSTNKSYTNNSASTSFDCSAQGSQPFSEEQMAVLLSLLNPKQNTSEPKSNMAGTGYFKSNMTCSNIFKDNPSWIIDSSANQHYITNAKYLTNIVDISDLNLVVEHPNGSMAKILKVGDCQVTPNVTLFDVLVVPEYFVNLMSVYKFVRDRFAPQRHDGKDLGDWKYARLGHPADPVLQILKGSLDFDDGSILPCDICHKAKQSREPFSLSDHVSHDIGHLIHLDIWGPYKVTSIDGYRYFLTIVDDFSRCNDPDVTPQKFGSLQTRPNDHIQNDYSSDGHGPSSTPKSTRVVDTSETSSDDDYIIPSFQENDSNSEGNVVHEPPVDNLRRSIRESVLPRKFNDYVMSSKAKYGIENFANCAKLDKRNFLFTSSLNKQVEPTNYFEASKDTNWVEAMNTEMEALYRNNTWVLTDLPPNRKPIGSKWIYKIKYKSTGEIERFKARLVAKGYSQTEGVDYYETFFPVVKMVTIRSVITLAVNKGWELSQLDINNAFLYGELDVEVYMSLPQGYFNKGETKVCKLNKSLYGLKQAPRKWNEKLCNSLFENGFVQSKCDYSMFIKDKHDIFVVLLVYVDDIVITGNNKAEIDSVKHFLKSKFLIKDLGLLKYFLGIEVVQTNDAIYLSKRKYCMELINEFGLLASKPLSTPIELNVSSYKGKDNEKVISNITVYQKLIGKLIYITITRPDISYAVHILSQFMHAPKPSHLNLAFRVLRYVKGCPGKGLSFSKSNSLTLSAYVDSDWGKNLINRRSITGFCIFLGNCLISWKSKKQPTVSKFSAEAEYRATVACTCEIIWIINLLTELKLNKLLPVLMHCDNNPAIQISANPVHHERTKHFDIDWHIVREKANSGVLNIVKVASVLNIADLFTKGLTSCQHKEFCDNLQLKDAFTSQDSGAMLNQV
ncbi:uncharacterized protein [Rutidosis leptorrhynchoides]|uniref:uncharacterized protein n=1 Tax=Rutidosis leptorrhynchoides TaxID=125765 RepID=UPI003A98FA76